MPKKTSKKTSKETKKASKQTSQKTSKKMKIFVVLGESSGDDLAADLHPYLVSRSGSLGIDLEIEGLAGPRLESLGIRSLFPISDISVMGIGGVFRNFFGILSRIRMTVDRIIEVRPDLVLLIDSPEFTHAVARRVRRRCPDIPIIDYVCPSVWAWRSGRARKMTKYIDHVLALFPFEVDSMTRLGGPPTTFVGHPLYDRISGLSKKRKGKHKRPVLVVLPGSRLSEVNRLGGLFGDVIDDLRETYDFDVVLCAVPHLRERIEFLVGRWDTSPKIVDSSENDRTFGSVDVALAASGTVSLQLALHRVPMVLVYKLDWLGQHWVNMMFRGWSVALPSLVAGWPLVPEYLNHEVRVERISRMVGRLLEDSPERHAQLSGFEIVASKMKEGSLASDRAAARILELLDAGGKDS